MAEPKNEDFLDDIEAAEAEELSAQTEEFDDEALELDSLRAERDEYKDRFMRALADALSPMAAMALAGGPTKTMPASSQAATNSAFSERNP